MGMKVNGQRVFILVIVGAFVLSSLGFSGLVIWDQLRNKDDTANSQQDVQKQLDALKAQNGDQNNQSNQQQGAKLQGTQLANFTPVSDVPTLQKIDIKEGTGEVVKPGAKVTAHYTGAVAATGVIFQSSHDSGQPIPFGLNQVIKGWTDGVPGMKVGGTRRLVIPADQAYGANPPAGSGIPANAALVFDIELTAVEQ